MGPVFLFLNLLLLLLLFVTSQECRGSRVRDPQRRPRDLLPAAQRLAEELGDPQPPGQRLLAAQQGPAQAAEARSQPAVKPAAVCCSATTVLVRLRGCREKVRRKFGTFGTFSEELRVLTGALVSRPRAFTYFVGVCVSPLRSHESHSMELWNLETYNTTTVLGQCRANMIALTCLQQLTGPNHFFAF